MTTFGLNLNSVDPSWKACIQHALTKVDPAYLTHLQQSQDWLPGAQDIFNAFSLPVTKVNYVLFGESPYPRRASANGYAFWDAAVEELWSPTGLSKKVNRATSLRNIIKMLLLAEGKLTPEANSQEHIAHINKQDFIQTNAEFFQNFLRLGFLLLNATLVLQKRPPQKDARVWAPFINEVLSFLLKEQPRVKFILFGRIAATLEPFLGQHPQVEAICAEHPYNITFITNPKVVEFFRPMHLLSR